MYVSVAHLRRPARDLLHLLLLTVAQAAPLRLSRIVSLPIKLVPPGSAPPPEAAQELMDSSLLRRLSATRVTTLFSDGVPAWPKAVKAVPGNIKAVAVSHKNFQFTRKWCLKRKPSKISNVAGTVCRPLVEWSRPFHPFAAP